MYLFSVIERSVNPIQRICISNVNPTAMLSAELPYRDEINRHLTFSSIANKRCGETETVAAGDDLICAFALPYLRNFTWRG